ncbi:MAG TPA: flagellar basal body L-ring protein FlgH [Tepidisphaeraceae bacterium]|jgi:flagellar L-ring protein precursor FlgH|nr:flagellar basal body L-ring protein FlgH [Tepidisphaeraceae bacterium]
MKRALLLTIALSTPVVAQVPSSPGPSTVARLQPPPTPAQQLRMGGGSLMRAGQANGAPQAAGVSLFSVTPPEPRTLKKHDLVTIIVREESNYTTEGKTDLKKEASVTAKLSEFVELDPGNLRIKAMPTGATPGVNFSASREMTGDGSVDRKDVVTLRITAEVLDVKPNDTVVLQARKQIKIDDEEQSIIIAGVCRAEDITADNTILSTQLGDVQMTKLHKGAVRDNTKRGWLTKLLDRANPF